MSDTLPPIADDFDMRNIGNFTAIVDAFKMMLDTKKTDVMRVVGPAPMGGEYIELVMDEQPLHERCCAIRSTFLLLSLLISCITATLVYLALHYMFVRPMRRITANMMAFRAAPENPGRVIAPSARVDEIGIAEARSSPPCRPSWRRCCTRRAGSPRSISPCRRSITTCATCCPRRSCSPTGSPASPIPACNASRWLMHALRERAIAFCQSTLSYGRLQEPPPERRQIALEPLVEEVHKALNLGAVRRSGGSARSSAA